MCHTRGQVQRARRGFENRFRNMVLIPAVEVFNMKIEPAFLHKCFKEFFDQFRLKVANACRFEIDLIYEVGPAGEVDHNPCERLI